MKMRLLKFIKFPFLLITFYCGISFSSVLHHDFLPLAKEDYFLPLAKEDYKHDQYFQIKESSGSGSIDLLNLENIKKPFPQPSVPYNRREQFENSRPHAI